MNAIIFLAVSAIFSVQVTAENSHEKLHMRGTPMDNAGVMKHMHDIFSTHGKQHVLNANSSSGVLVSPLPQITEPGYFSTNFYTDTTCSNSNSLALGASLLLNTCSLSSSGIYTKTLGFEADTAEGFNKIVTSAYIDPQCLKQIGASNTSTSPSTCMSFGSTLIGGFSTLSLQSSFSTKLTYPTANTGIISQNYAAEGCAGTPIVTTYYRSGLCLGGASLSCSGSTVKSTVSLTDATCPKEGDTGAVTGTASTGTCENDPEILYNTEDVTLGSFSSVSCQQAASGANSKRGLMDVLLGAIAGSAVLFLLF
jgi:hypothetical protein